MLPWPYRRRFGSSLSVMDVSLLSLFWHQLWVGKRKKKSWLKKRKLACPSPSLIFLVSVERMTGLATLEKEKVAYLGWLPWLLGYQAILKAAFFACSLVSGLGFRNSAFVVCVLNAHRCIQTSGCVCVCVNVCVIPEILFLLRCCHVHICHFVFSAWQTLCTAVWSAKILPPTCRDSSVHLKTIQFAA